MSNRSYLYTVDKVPAKKVKLKPIRAVGEWAWDIPITHLVLASESPKVCRSTIWQGNTAVLADFAAGRDRLLSFLDVLAKTKAKKPKAKDFATQIALTKTHLVSKEVVGKFTLLEGGEIFDMSGYSGSKAVKMLVTKQIPAMTKKVDRAIAGKEARWLTKIAKEWNDLLGMNWSNVLYFSQ